MSRKYICDGCGKWFDSAWHWSSPGNGFEVANLYVLSLYPLGTLEAPNAFKIGEYCDLCQEKIKKILKEGWKV